MKQIQLTQPPSYHPNKQMNVLEQIKKFVTTALQNNDTVELDGQEISEITCRFVEHRTTTCQRIYFTVIFTTDSPYHHLLKKGEHDYFLDIDTNGLIMTDTNMRIETVPLAEQDHDAKRTVRLYNPFDRFDRKYIFSFCIKKKVPTFTIDVNDL